MKKKKKIVSIWDEASELADNLFDKMSESEIEELERVLDKADKHWGDPL